MELLHAAGPAVLLVGEKKKERRKTDEDVDNPLDRRPCSEDHVHYVPVAADKTSDTDEPPIQSANDEENKGDDVYYFHSLIQSRLYMDRGTTVSAPYMVLLRCCLLLQTRTACALLLRAYFVGSTLHIPGSSPPSSLNSATPARPRLFARATF
jgi:hypothetical protein